VARQPLLKLVGKSGVVQGCQAIHDGTNFLFREDGMPRVRLYFLIAASCYKLPRQGNDKCDIVQQIW
jgi:hypothetical protein